MTIATWIIAISAAVTALGSVSVQIHHGRRDNTRFSAHAERLDTLERDHDQQG